MIPIIPGGSPDLAIRIEGLGKRYRLGGRLASYETLRERIVEAIKAPFQRLAAVARGQASVVGHETIWALKGVDLEVERGEVLGIIGRNGAGKSTLLKILCRITAPTEGEGEIRGRVGSLLEVGTGFHPELTGRENVYLNGAILGMRKAEIQQKFDDIIGFAEVERFVDTPVKHYSSGMYLRLAFAVAAHLDPEILLVDEVLAVGDADFQSKCLGKMDEVARRGRTVLFVSHNLQAVRQLCTRVVLLEDGRLTVSAEPNEAIAAYVAGIPQLGGAGLLEEIRSEEIHVKKLAVFQDDVENSELLDNQRPFEVRIDYRLFGTTEALLMGFEMTSNEGTLLFRTYDLLSRKERRRLPGVYTSTCTLPAGLFQTGSYVLHLIVGIHRLRWISKDEIAIRLRFSGPKVSDATLPGVIQPMGTWEATRHSDEE